MKKTLLSLSAIAIASSAFAFGNLTTNLISSDKFETGPSAPAIAKTAQTRASGAIDFSYSETPYTAYSLSQIVGAGSRFCLLIEMAPEDIKAYAGNKVTGFSMYSPTDYQGTKNSINEARFFYTTDLKSEQYTQDFEIPNTAFTLNEVSLETPYTITGDEEHLYFGYSFIIPKKNDMYYIVVDGIPNNYDGSIIFGYSSSGDFPTNFDTTAAPEIGALCMSLKIEGDNLPENIASIVDVDTPSNFPVNGEGINVDFVVQNKAANDLSSVEVTASVTGMPDIVQTFEFSPIPYSASTLLTFNGVKANEEAFVDFSLQVTKVNGEAFDGQKVTVSVPAFNGGFVRKIVAEDATGTWCGWCPGGIEALDYLKSNYPDRAIAIGVHCSNGNMKDPMEISEYLKFVSDYVGGFPNVLYNRMISQTPTTPYPQVCEFVDQVAAYYDYPTYAGVALDGHSSEDGKTASVTASAEFLIASSVPHYLSFVIVEDGVGPYMQENYYKQQRIEMNGWEKKASKISTVFNDVARYYNCYPGIKNSLPASIKANSVNEYSVELPLDNVTGNEYRVIALLTNAVTGEIVNAAEFSMTKDNSGSAVGTIDSFTPVEYYNLNGQKVANPSDGIFIRRQGGNATKVIIR